MTGWNINYNGYTADGVYNSVEKGEYLVGFTRAEESLKNLKNLLGSALSDARFYAESCESEARHYEAMQKELQSHPENFTARHAWEESRKSPSALYGFSSSLKDGAGKLENAIAAVDEMLKKLDYAKNAAKEDGKRVLEKIAEAMRLMESFKRVRF